MIYDCFYQLQPSLNDVRQQRALRLHDVRLEPTTTLGQANTSLRYMTHLMGHLYNLYSSFRSDRKCKSLLLFAWTKQPPDLRILPQWNCPICCIVCVSSLLKLLSVIHKVERWRLSLCKTFLKERRVILSTNNGRRKPSYTCYILNDYDWYWQHPWLLLNRILTIEPIQLLFNKGFLFCLPIKEIYINHFFFNLFKINTKSIKYLFKRI